MSRHFLFITLALLLMTARFATAQGLLVDIASDHRYQLPRPILPPPIPPPHPIPPRPAPEPVYQIKALDVNVNVQDQIAKVQLTQSFVNRGSRQLEVCFIFPLPYDGAVDQMTFMVDGKEIAGKLLNAEEARKIYESHVRRNQDPALVEWMGTGMFKTSVFPVPPGAERKVTLRFTQLCRKHGGLTELVFPWSTAKYTSSPIENINLQVSIQSQSKIKNVYSPSHTVEIQRPNDNSAQIKYSASQAIPTADFQLLYDVGDGPVGANVISHRTGEDDGFFMLLISPDIKRTEEKSIPKTVIFVADKSGSMSGKKIEQAKGAIRFVLNNLGEGDLFNIVAYDSNVESFRPELQRFNDETRTAALGYVEGLYAGGSTNIDGALTTAMSQLQDGSRPNYVLFFTDGLPTAGERNEAKIANNAKDKNKVRARVFSLGVGYDVNSRLLDKISRDCFGQSNYVRPNEDIEAHVSALYNRIGAPVMTDISITFDMEEFPAEKGTLANRLYPKEVYDLFAGDQMVIVGRYKKGGAARVTIRGTVDGTKHEFHFPVTLVDKSNDESYAFAEKLWAMRRVGEIIDEIDLKGKNDELVNELVQLSTKHGIITPYTAFLADETAKPTDLATATRRAGVALESLSQAEGVSGFVQRDIKAQLQRSDFSLTPSFAAGGMPAAPAAAGLAGSTRGRRNFALKDIQSDTEIQVTNVRQLGQKTFYLREGRWVDSELNSEQEKKVKTVKRFSDEYFDLVNRYGKDTAKYISTEDNIVLLLGGQAYTFE